MENGLENKILKINANHKNLLKGAHSRAGRNPTTGRHGNFWLLGFPPGPIRSSLDNLDLPDSSSRSMLMPSLVRTPVQRKRRPSRTPSL